MNKIHVLDCTLRDGGYCNQWKFGFNNVKRIIKRLIEAEIDVIECGFLTQKVGYTCDSTQFTSVNELRDVIPCVRNGKVFVAMINYGEYNVTDLPKYDGTSVDGIRVAFHKKDLKDALLLCQQIKDKGYKVFVQPMVSLNYTDEEFLSMIRLVNNFEPYAFYIVDSFGVMKRKELFRLFYIVENNLREKIWIGFHSHNNMQLAYSNAQSLVDIPAKRNLIIDSTIYGMGRGAGNLNTELIVEYLVENASGNYILKPLLNAIDESIIAFYQKNYWGYSLPNYLSATHGLHPSYASYLSNKNTLTVEAMNEIFKMIEEEKRYEFDKDYVERLYSNHTGIGKAWNCHISELKECLTDHKILLIAPGKSVEKEKSKIVDFVQQNDVLTISINFEYFYVDTDFIFLSNLRRFRDLDEEKHSKCITTSNILAEDVYYQTSYYDLLLPNQAIRDNAGIMAIKFLMDFRVNNIFLAGFDGYSYDSESNYALPWMTLVTKKELADAMNQGMREALKDFSKKINISFLTEPINISI